MANPPAPAQAPAPAVVPVPVPVTPSLLQGISRAPILLYLHAAFPAAATAAITAGYQAASSHGDVSQVNWGYVIGYTLATFIFVLLLGDHWRQVPAPVQQEVVATLLQMVQNIAAQHAATSVAPSVHLHLPDGSVVPLDPAALAAARTQQAPDAAKAP